MSELRGMLEGRGRRFAIVAASFNDLVVSRLLAGAVSCFRSHGISEDDVLVAWVPGSFELPLAAQRVARSGLYDAIVCVGAVVRGETPHFQFVSAETAGGIREVGLETGVPVIFGVVTADTMEQALDRAGGKGGNRGWDAAMAALEMADLLDQLPEKE